MLTDRSRLAYLMSFEYVVDIKKLLIKYVASILQ